jgi:L-seryl-tRNA(Ser) seleniumtransferase
LVTGEARSLADALRARCLRGELPLAEIQPQLLIAALARNIEERLAPRLCCVLNLSGTVSTPTFLTGREG